MAIDPMALLNQAGQNALALPNTVLNMSTRHLTEIASVGANEVTKIGSVIPQLGQGLQLPVLGQGLPQLPNLPMMGGTPAPAPAPATLNTVKRTQSVKMNSYLEK